MQFATYCAHICDERDRLLKILRHHGAIDTLTRLLQDVRNVHAIRSHGSHDGSRSELANHEQNQTQNIDN